jgi:hypothetical protein
VFTIFFDVVMEGLFLMPMGLFTTPEPSVALPLPRHYYQYPIYEAFLWGAVQAGLCSIRFFTDDRGRTFVERGLERVQGGFVKQQSMRFLAIFAACSLFFFVFYNLPAQWLAMHADPWPEDIQKRSYFTMGICGEGRGDSALIPPFPSIGVRPPPSSARMARWSFPKGRSSRRSFPSSERSDMATSGHAMLRSAAEAPFYRAVER